MHTTNDKNCSMFNKNYTFIQCYLQLFVIICEI